jgi:hypothetical protein
MFEAFLVKKPQTSRYMGSFSSLYGKNPPKKAIFGDFMREARQTAGGTR